MNPIIVYSSLSGNTKKIAEAIAETIGCPLWKVSEVPQPVEYDTLFLGFWVNKGTADQQTQEFLTTITNKKIALFGTMGAYPDSNHADECRKRVELLASENNQFLGVFLCQGKIDPNLTAAFRQGKTSPHPMTPEREARHQEAAKHPDTIDIHNAKQWAQEILNTL